MPKKKRKKKGGWGLKRIRVAFNVLIAKVEGEFEKDIPKKASRMQRRRIKREVGTELARITREEGQPRNIIADTISQIADKERKRAIRSGDWETAIFSSVVQYYADQESKGS